MALVHNPYQQYQQSKKQSIETADRVTLITMLLEGALSYNKRAIIALEEGEKKLVLENVDSAVKIVLHLYSCINFDQGGEVAEKLASLYNFVCDQYVRFQKEANDKAILESVNSILETIFEAWKQLPKQDSK